MHGLLNSFKGFCQNKRILAYNSLIHTTLESLPELLLYLLLLWRFKTPYNQLEITNPNWCPDLLIQNALITKYRNTKTKIVILDLDYNLTQLDIDYINPYNIVLQGIITKFGISCSLGIDLSVLNDIQINKKCKDLSYVGNLYMRLDDIKLNISEYADYHYNMVHFYGNWLRLDKQWFRLKYPTIIYHDRIGIGLFNSAMSDAIGVPLLARNDYKENGFMTFRFVLSILFGSIPIGFSDFNHIDKYLPNELIAISGLRLSLLKIILWLRIELHATLVREYLINDKISKLFNIKTFINKVL